MSDPLVEICIEETGWETALPEFAQVAERAAALALEVVEIAPKGLQVSLLACGDDQIAALNGAFRGKPVPTNVLSWPAFDLAPDASGQRPDLPSPQGSDLPVLLGDVAIALQTCVQEAESLAIPLKNHVTHLILHGCLHLLGYDHETSAEAEVMEGLETRALGTLGIPDPYGERTCFDAPNR